MANFDWEKAQRNEVSAQVKGRDAELQKTLKSYIAFRQAPKASVVMFISKIRNLRGGLRELQDLIKSGGSKAKILSKKKHSEQH